MQYNLVQVQGLIKMVPFVIVQNNVHPGVPTKTNLFTFTFIFVCYIRTPFFLYLSFVLHFLHTYYVYVCIWESAKKVLLLMARPLTASLLILAIYLFLVDWLCVRGLQTDRALQSLRDLLDPRVLIIVLHHKPVNHLPATNLPS